MKDRSAHCCLCGVPRRPTQKPVETFGLSAENIHMNTYRPMLPGRWEDAPQMLATVCLWRNGGTAPGETHMCDACIVVGLTRVKSFVDNALTALTTHPTTTAGGGR